MSSALQKFAREWIPLATLRIARRLMRPAVFTGDHAAWTDARGRSRGYDDAAIFDRAVAAARAVRDGQAAYERDTVQFPEAAFHWPLLSGMLRAAARNGGRLHVVDFGGALGSTWWQHRAWFDRLADVSWEVVEQPHFVVAGAREFETGPLRFCESLDACRAKPESAVILLSSVLPYVEAPHALLADIARRRFQDVVIDRTGFVRAGRDRLTVQQVPPSIYDASYPCWFFDREKLLRPFAADYRVMAEWPSFDQADIPAEFRGLMLERISR